MLSSFGHVMTAGICRHLSWSCVVSMFLDLLLLVLSTIITILYIRSYSIIYFLEIRIIFNLLHFSLLNYVSLRTIFHQSLALPAIDSRLLSCSLSLWPVTTISQCSRPVLLNPAPESLRELEKIPECRVPLQRVSLRQSRLGLDNQHF